MYKYIYQETHLYMKVEFVVLFEGVICAFIDKSNLIHLCTNRLYVNKANQVLLFDVLFIFLTTEQIIFNYSYTANLSLMLYKCIHLTVMSRMSQGFLGRT